MDEVTEIYTNLRSSESTFWLPGPYYNVVKLRHFTHVGDDGNFALPDIFYDGVVYGLTWEHSHDNEVNTWTYFSFNVVVFMFGNFLGSFHALHVVFKANYN